MKILIPDRMTPESLELMASAHEVVYDPSLAADLPALMRAAADADGMIVRNRIQVRGELLAAMARCRVVGRLGVGLDNIDLDACAARGIEVIPAVGANARAVAEYVAGTAMILLRRGYHSSDAVLRGEWPREALAKGQEIWNKTLGVVGYGSVGRETARLCSALGMQIVACDIMPPRADPSIPARITSFDEVIAVSDVISLHMPLVPSTLNLIGATAMAAMKPGAILINAARGGVVDEAALAAALRSGHLGGAALDVFADEPLAAGSGLEGAPNLLLTPHIAGVTQQSETRVCALVAQRVVEALG